VEPVINQGNLMNRNVLLLSGVLCWTLAAVDGLLHLVNGDLVVPIAMVVISVAWVGLRSNAFSIRRRAEVAIEA
jgi:hypothetical protein